jgi:hypothetical protein
MQSHKYPYLKDLVDRTLLDAMPYLRVTLELNSNTQDVLGF